MEVDRFHPVSAKEGARSIAYTLQSNLSLCVLETGALVRPSLDRRPGCTNLMASASWQINFYPWGSFTRALDMGLGTI